MEETLKFRCTLEEKNLLENLAKELGVSKILVKPFPEFGKF